MNINLLILIILFTILIFKIIKIDFFSNKIDDIRTKYFSIEGKMGDKEKENYLQDIININKSNYLEYKKYNENIKKKYPEINLGYTELKDVNKDSIGFCPLGYYYRNDTPFEGKKRHLLTKCRKCFKCNQKPGYYTSGGCVGDKDSVCKYGKIPYDLYLENHKHPFYNHNILPQHQHKYNFKYNEKGLCPNITPDESPNCNEKYYYEISEVEHNHKKI